MAGSKRSAQAFQSAGLIAILKAGPDVSLPTDDLEAAAHLIRLFERDGVLVADHT